MSINIVQAQNDTMHLEKVELKQGTVWVPAAEPLRKPWTWGSNVDLFLLQLTLTDRSINNLNFVPRFTAFPHFGILGHYEFSPHFGFQTGLGIKNLGIIAKQDSLVVKERTLTIGLPLFFKIGNLAKRNFLLIGGGIDFPFHYKTKAFMNGTKISKTSEWGSGSNTDLLPYLGFGISVQPGVVVKSQYYLNDVFSEKPNIYMQSRKLLLITLGFDMQFKQRQWKRYVDDGE